MASRMNTKESGNEEHVMLLLMKVRTMKGVGTTIKVESIKHSLTLSQSRVWTSGSKD